MSVRRIFVEKRAPFDVAAQSLFADLKENLRLQGLEGVRIVNRYDIEGISDTDYEAAKEIVFAEPPVDVYYNETMPINDSETLFAIEYLPGQYDQRADSTAQCIQLLSHGSRPSVATAQVILLNGTIDTIQLELVKKYLINPVDSREASLDKPETLVIQTETPPDVAVIAGFISFDDSALEKFRSSMGLAMRFEDIAFCQEYFKTTEKRDPSITEIRMLDTYWSDHCRHTTFLTTINDVTFETGALVDPIKEAYELYNRSRDFVYSGRTPKDPCLMDIATLGMKELSKKGILDNLDSSEEINACSIVVPVVIDGVSEDWLVMFKNETHNHPTEIEPFGGAATCLGGAIRDPLSGRSYVYQAMRVTGSGDPRKKLEDTLAGKLPQRKITEGAAHGYSSYGNQIGLATGLVSEIYDEGYVAKRMEIGAVVGAAPKSNVVRLAPEPGDIVVLVGGRTGRDGCGGATGSSKEHTEESIATCSAEVQKGNPPTERKIQRLFRNPAVSTLIKRCNDFGAGGVSVAIGELAPGLSINLDAVPKKYEGLDGTELAISESQERMAVVISPVNLEKFVAFASQENLESAVVAHVTKEQRLQMHWRGKKIVDISREFIDTNGVSQKTDIVVTAPVESESFFKADTSLNSTESLVKRWKSVLENINVCSQQGLVERFDSTIGAGTVLLPFGGKYQATPIETMVAKLPVLHGETTTGTAMSYGFNPQLSHWSPFHGAVYAIVESIAKIVACGGDYRTSRLTLQEYFEKLGSDPVKWGKPFAALLGAFYAQLKIGVAAIGGKDSMSGTFKNITVPPTLVSFALSPVDTSTTISPEFKMAGSLVVVVELLRDNNELPDFLMLGRNYQAIHSSINSGHIISAHTVRAMGLCEALSKMCFGNRIGIAIDSSVEIQYLFSSDLGSIVVELRHDISPETVFKGLQWKLIGQTTKAENIVYKDSTMSLEELYTVWQEPLSKIFPIEPKHSAQQLISTDFLARIIKKPAVRVAKPKVLITVFPGTNCEYDTARAFEKAGAEPEIFVLKNLVPGDIDESIKMVVKKLAESQILMIPGGFSAGDEPDGSGKFIAAFFHNPSVKDAVNELLGKRDGLALGICNGFQALVKLGLVPWGEIRELDSSSPTLTFNTIGRHISRIAYTRICSVQSPWFANVELGDVHAVPISHGEGRFVAPKAVIDSLGKNGQIATRYVNAHYAYDGTLEGNPNGSYEAIEAITSLDGRVLGKMAHSERHGQNIGKNIVGKFDQGIFKAGVDYFG